MATDIAGTITATYDASILVPDDGDYANQAALVAMVRPIANRVAYLKERFEDAPWARSEFFEDFKSLISVTDAEIFDTPWQHFSTNPGSMSLVGGFADALGVLSLSNSSGTASADLLSKGIIAGIGNFLCRAENFRRAVLRVRTGNVVSGMNCEFGIDADSQHAVTGTGAAITVVFEPAVSANWRLRVHDGVSAVFTDTGVAVAANTWYELDLRSDGFSVVSLSVDGAAAVVASPGDLPALTTDMAFVLRFETPNAGATRNWRSDFCYGLFDVPGRVL